jgi:DNA-binding transcriptional LysR family regulator
MTQSFEIRSLRLFLGVIASGSFSACARAHHLSQPALSRIIGQMESRIGARLFDRDSRTVSLTPAGEELAAIATAIVREADLGASRLEDFVNGRRGRLVIAALPSLAVTLLPPAIARFQSLWPAVDFAVLDGLSAPVVSSVVEGRADFGLAMTPEPSLGLDYQELLSDPFGLVCRPDHPLAGRTQAAWSDFQGQPLVAIAGASSVRSLTDAAFLRDGGGVKPSFECNHLATAGAMIAQGLGIAALPRLVLPLLGPEPLVWRPLGEPGLSRSLGILSRKDGLSRLARRFVAHLTAG